MRICYNVEGNYSINNEQWFLLNYQLVDSTHSNGPPLGEIKTKFYRGDIVDIAFPVGNPDLPKYKNVNAIVTNGPDGHIPERGWMITVYYDTPGVDFGEGYRVIYEAKFDNIQLSNFIIAFVFEGQEGMPGDQPWGFTAANAPGQHTELGQTSLFNMVPPGVPNNLVIK